MTLTSSVILISIVLTLRWMLARSTSGSKENSQLKAMMTMMKTQRSARSLLQIYFQRKEQTRKSMVEWISWRRAVRSSMCWVRLKRSISKESSKSFPNNHKAWRRRTSCARIRFRLRKHMRLRYVKGRKQAVSLTITTRRWRRLLSKWRQTI